MLSSSNDATTAANAGSKRPAGGGSGDRGDDGAGKHARTAEGQRRSTLLYGETVILYIEQKKMDYNEFQGNCVVLQIGEKLAEEVKRQIWNASNNLDSNDYKGFALERIDIIPMSQKDTHEVLVRMREGKAKRAAEDRSTGESVKMSSSSRDTEALTPLAKEMMQQVKVMLAMFAMVDSAIELPPAQQVVGLMCMQRSVNILTDMFSTHERLLEEAERAKRAEAAMRRMAVKKD